MGVAKSQTRLSDFHYFTLGQRRASGDNIAQLLDLKTLNKRTLGLGNHSTLHREKVLLL